MLAGRAMFVGRRSAVNEKGRSMSTIPTGLSSAAKRALWIWFVRSARAVAANIVPPTCCLCGAPGQAPDLDLCGMCAKALPINRSPGGLLTLKPASGDEEVSASVRVFVPFVYAYPVDHLVRALKFRGERAYARVLGLLLAHAYRESGGRLPQMIVPIPLHNERYRGRGFNQAHEIARFAAAHLGVPVETHCLARRFATREQSGLSVAERRLNVRRAFAVTRPLRAERIALVDDVLTTGSTASTAARALLDAGAIEVQLWAVARVLRA